MIERHWKGIARKERANEYIAHLRNDTFEEIKKISGFISASILKRDLSEGVEFLVITKWETLEVIKQFAGERIETAVVPKLVQDIMVTYDKNVGHYEVNFTTEED
jgi:heme-degrading monooxygenase HmoA